MKTMPKNDSLSQAADRAEERAGEKFRQERVAAYKAELQKAADKLELPLNEENLPVLAREARNASSE